MVLLCVVFFSAVAPFGSHGTFIQGDGVEYFAWVRSVVFDGDVDFTNVLAASLGGCFTPSLTDSALWVLKLICRRRPVGGVLTTASD